METKSKILLKKYFDEEPENETYFEDILKDIKNFNVTITRYLKNTKKNEYWYWSWW